MFFFPLKICMYSFYFSSTALLKKKRQNERTVNRLITNPNCPPLGVWGVCPTLEITGLDVYGGKNQ